jgi:hypothetical protein
MRMSELIYHKHYWSIPHSREIDNRIVQICYDCGKERVSPISFGFRERDVLREPDGFCNPNEASDGSGEQAVPFESAGEEKGPVLPHPQPRLDILEALAKRFYWKKKLAGG